MKKQKHGVEKAGTEREKRRNRERRKQEQREERAGTERGKNRGVEGIRTWPAHPG